MHVVRGRATAAVPTE